MAVEYIEEKVLAVGDRTGMVVYRPKTLVAGKKYPLIIFHPGIGERGTGNDADLERLRVNGSVSTLEAGARVHEFIVVEVQPKTNYELNETDEAYAYMKEQFGDNINWLKVYITGLSLGGGGVYRYLAEHPDAHLKIAAASPMCAGGLEYFVASKYYPTLVNTKVPIWAFHNKGDATVTPAASTLKVANLITSMKGTAKQYSTIYLRDGHTWPAYGFYGTVDAATPTNAENFNKTIWNMYEWFLLNEVGKPAVYPDYVPPVQEPPIQEPPVDPKPTGPVRISGVWTEGGIKTLHDSVGVVFYKDGTQQTFRAPAGDRGKGIWITQKDGNITFNIAFEKAPGIWIDKKPGT